MNVPRYATYPSLAGRHALVTGGASGIGAEIVAELHRQGARVSVFDLLPGEPGEGLHFTQLDLTDAKVLAAAVAERIADWGPIRALVNNAASDERHALGAVTPERWDAIQAVNLRHHLFTTQAVSPAMAEAGGGAIVSLSSTSWIQKVGGMPGYLAAKAGIIGLVRALARELGPQGIRVNTVSPGWVLTPRQREKWVRPGDEDMLRRTQCIPELLDPGDVARLVAFLLADDSRMITGQNHIVDGGQV